MSLPPLDAADARRTAASLLRGRTAADDLGQPVLWGAKLPHWTCSTCHSDSNWASRILCAGCAQKAPHSVYVAALLAHEERPDRSAVRRPGPRSGDHSRGRLPVRRTLAPWTADAIKKKEESAADLAVSEYHAQVLAALGDDCPDHLRQRLPPKPVAADKPTERENDPAAHIRQLRHELAQNLKSIDASEAKLTSLREDIAKRTARNAEIEAALRKHEMELARAALPEKVEGDSDQANQLNAQLDNLRTAIDAFHISYASYKAPAPTASEGQPAGTASASNPAGSATSPVPVLAPVLDDMELDFDQLDDESILAMGPAIREAIDVEGGAASTNVDAIRRQLSTIKPLISKTMVRRKVAKKTPTVG